MSPKKSVWILLIFLALSCSRQQKIQRDQQNYDVVQEGSTTGGATSTINAPGEQTPPMTSSTITGTNVDTTTAFTLPGTTTTTSTAPPGTIAGTLQTNTGGSIYGSRPPRPRVERAPAPPMSSSTTTGAPPPQTEGLPTTTDTVAPPTDTKKEKDRNPPPPPTDPTSTGTQG